MTEPDHCCFINLQLSSLSVFLKKTIHLLLSDFKHVLPIKRSDPSSVRILLSADHHFGGFFLRLGGNTQSSLINVHSHALEKRYPNALLEMLGVL